MAHRGVGAGLQMHLAAYVGGDDDGWGIAFEIANAHRTQILRLAFAADGSLLASCSHDHTAKLWRVERNGDSIGLKSLRTFDQHSDSVHSVAFSSDGHTLATAGYDGQVGLFDVETGKGKLFKSAERGQVLTVEFTADGKQLMTVNREDLAIRFWDVGSDHKKPVLELPKLQDRPMWASLRPDGHQLAAVGRDAVVTLYDLGPEPAATRRLVGHEQTVYRASYGPDGRQLATVSTDMTVRLWDLATDKALFTMRLPTEFRQPSPLWDFDFRCTPAGDCWIAVPLTMGRLALYRLPYRDLP